MSQALKSVGQRQPSGPAPWSSQSGRSGGVHTHSNKVSNTKTAQEEDETLFKEKVEDARFDRHAIETAACDRAAAIQAARNRAAAERDAEPTVPRLYFWTPDIVAKSLDQLGFPECAHFVVEHKLEGRRFLGLEGESPIGNLLEPIAKDIKAMKKVAAYFRSVRGDELASAPKTTALITTKVDDSKRTSNLNLNQMKMTFLPDMICDVPQLVNLSACQNNIKFLPGEIGQLTRLVNLKLGNNKLISLPDSIGRCKALQMLMLEENEIKELPRSLGNCHALRVIDVSRNKLRMIPSTLSKCKKIVKLVAFDNPLKMPREVMDEGTAAIVSLLEAIGDAEEGQYLRMFNIKLKAIPEFTFDMTSLTMLNLDNNSLKHLDGLHILTGLTSLSFTKNNVEHVPIAFAALTNLREFKYESNPITSPPLHVIALGSQVLVRYLAARAALLSENLREAFDVFDDDKSGAVSKQEMIDGMSKVSINVKKEDAIALIEEHDDGNGLIDFEEFKQIILKLIKRRSGRDNDDEAQKVFEGNEQIQKQGQADALEDEILDLSKLGMTEYSIDLDEPARVTVLNLAKNMLTDLPVVKALKSLHTIILDDNPFTGIPETILKLRKLRRLSIKRCRLQSLPESIFSYPGLEELRIDGNHFASLPCDLVRMTSLKELSMDDNPFRDPLMSITREGKDYTMAYLRFFYTAREFGVLDLREMDFIAMPFESDVKRVNEIILCKNRFQSSPDLLLQAEVLAKLDLSENFIEKIPSALWQALTNLVTLRLSKNRLSALARTIGDMHKLESFWCDENTLTDLPNTLSSMHSLKFFDLTHNRLDTLQVSVGGLTKLETMILTRNSLKTLPEEIKGMTSLKTFLIRSNEMESIPDVWDHMNLKQLDLSRNPLKAIPLSLGALFTCTEELSIDRHLHLDDPPDNMVARGTKPLLSYLQKQYFARKSRDLILSTFHLSKVTVSLQQLDFVCGGIRTLDLSDNNIQVLPRNLGMCAFLEALLVRDNRLAEFPQSAKQLKSLTHLDAAGNSLDSIPEMLTYTPNIKILDLSRNQISSLYRTVDSIASNASGGMNDALVAQKRAKSKSKAALFEGRKFRQVIETKVMDQVVFKIRAENRSKQVGALFQLYKLQSLSLASNFISLLPGTVARFSDLRELNMSHNELSDMPPDIGDVNKLRKVDLSHNKLYGIPMEFGNLVKCTILDVSHNRLTALPDEIGRMTNLTNLNFESNNLIFLPVTLEALETSLTTLNANENKILDPPAEILAQGRDAVFTYFRRVRNGQKCRSLVLIDMKLEVLELNWANLTVLTALELSGNRIKALPGAMLCLTNLLMLKAAGNNLQRMFDAENLLELSNITRLALKENKMTEIESYIGDLVNLKDLDLSCNELVKIAPQIEKCTKIKTLSLAQNQLDYIPRNVFRILELESLDVSNNNLIDLPPALSYCQSIKELNISQNRLQCLPNDIGNLLVLERLDANTNLLRALPPSIKHCEHLIWIDLNNNKLSFVPSEIKKLKRLKCLKIKDNNIISIPMEIKDLNKLETLEMDGNIFLSAPSSIKDLPNIKEISINASQTSALFFGGNDITPVLNIKEISEDRVVLNKVPRFQILQSTDAMSCYLDRMHQRESIPSLNLTHMGLTFLPQEVFVLSCLTVLDVKENDITFLPETIGWLSKLVQLDVSVNKMKRLPDAIGSLTNLMTLGLGRNQLEFLPASMSGLTSLKYIDVHVNSLETLLPEEIFMEYEKSQEEADALFAFRRRGSGANTPSTPDSTGPTTVAKPATPSAPNTPNTPSRRLRRHSSLHANAEAAQMNIVKSSVKLLKGGVVLLAGLRDFECSYNELSELPDMSEMVNLTRVNVAHNSLRDLPEVICDLVGLEKIECGDNRVRRVPESVSKLTRLTLLSLKNNNLRTLPKELGECMALKTLSLNANALVDLPDHLCNLENLKRLTLAGNHLERLPWRMGNMKCLQILDLASNPVIRLPPTLGLLNDVLQKIELFECECLVDPPPPIIEAGHGRMMDYLRKLWRGFSTMRMIMTGLFMGRVNFDLSHPDLQGLVELRLDKNDLKVIPESIAALPSLLSLRFRENAVMSLAECFTKITTLQELDMSKNRFVAIPPSVLALTQLKRLRVTNNPIPYTMPNDWIEGDVGEWLRNYIRETIGRRISAMWSNNNLSEVLEAWKDIVDDIILERKNQGKE